MIRALVLAFSLLVAFAPAAGAKAKIADPVSAALDTAFARASSKVGNPGVQAVLLRNGTPVWSTVSGKAINSPTTPVTSSTMFAYASFSKLVLATYALHQVETGTLSLDSPISTYLGNDVPGSNTVTLRMLLQHTAGYPDIYGAPETADLFLPGDQYDPNRPYTWSMLAPGIHAPVAPGTKWEYSNTGFIIIAHLLSRVSGGDAALASGIRAFVQQTGATSTELTAERSDSAFLRFAHGYTVYNGKTIDYFTRYGATGIPTDVYGMPFGDGMFAGTALGAAKLLDALYARKQLLLPATVTQMIKVTPQSVQAGEPYGMGTLATSVSGRSWQGHSGLYGGFTSLGGTDMTRGVTLMVVTNQEGKGAARTIWTDLAKAYASATS
ncbi:serine hydrolase domain-containing protein [Nonomuraea sp. NPDC001636]|uniref:serine hydrolase domain-containing protein n=1 Tax=Nonomuraea sp. NPDC001636 TaxID=3154391 RepID=UPI00331DD846